MKQSDGRTRRATPAETRSVASSRPLPTLSDTPPLIFPAEGIAFLKSLKAHNDRDWFNPRKEDYKRLVEEPMKDILFAISAACCKRGLPLHAKEKNPVFRIYRDIRFSNDKTPFKTHVGAELRRTFSGSECILYIHVASDECFFAAGVWQASKDLLNAWRRAMTEDPDRFESMITALRRKKLALSDAHCLKTVPRGFQNYADQPVGKWLRLLSFIVRRDLQPSDCHSPKMVDTALEFALAAKPLFEYAWEMEAVVSTGAKARM